jgi:glutathione peroxidase-family protein
VTWNFNKFLTDRGGRVVARIGSRAEPLSGEVIEAVERALAAP